MEKLTTPTQRRTIRRAIHLGMVCEGDTRRVLTDDERAMAVAEAVEINDDWDRLVGGRR